MELIKRNVPLFATMNGVGYRSERVRLGSFVGWPVTFLSPADLAAAGFYYTRSSDIVRCFCCGLELYKWEEGDSPQSLHQRWQGQCRFLRKLPCGNVPLGVDPTTVHYVMDRTAYRPIIRHYSEDDTNESRFTPQVVEEMIQEQENDRMLINVMIVCFVIFLCFFNKE